MRIPKLLDLCNACGGCKSRTEIEQIRKQAAEQLDEDARETEQSEIDRISRDISQEVEESMKEEMSAAEQESEEAEKVAEKKRDYISACKLALQCKDKIFAMKTWVWVDVKVKEVIAAILFMYGYTKDQVYPQRKSTLEWATLLERIDEKLFQAIAKTEKGDTFAGPRTGLKDEHKLKFISDMALRAGAPFGDGIDVEKAGTVCPAFGVLFGLVQAGLNLRKEDVEARKQTYLKAKKAAEEAKEADPENAEEFTEPPPWGADDDMDE